MDGGGVHEGSQNDCSRRRSDCETGAEWGNHVRHSAVRTGVHHRVRHVSDEITLNTRISVPKLYPIIPS